MSEVEISAQRTPPTRLTLILLTALSVLTLNLFLPSLPSMAKDFNVSYGAMSAAISAYLLISAAFALVLGPLADHFGRRPVLLITFSIFALASVGAALTEDFRLFIAFRMAQAVCATGSTLSRAIVRDMYPPGRGTSVLGYIAMAMSVAPLIGPMLGGLLEETLGWRSVFWTFALLGTLSVALIWVDLGETALGKGRGMRAQFDGYLEVLRSWSFWMYTMVIGCSVTAFFIFLAGAPFVATEVYGLRPSSVGLAMGSTAAGFFFGSFVAGRIAERTSLGLMMVVGRIIAMIGPLIALVLVLVGVTEPWFLFGLMVTIGVGNGISLPSANTGAMSVRPDLAGSASGLSAALATTMGAIGSALTGAVLTPENSDWLFCLLLVLICAASVAFAFFAGRAHKDV